MSHRDTFPRVPSEIYFRKVRHDQIDYVTPATSCVVPAVRCAGTKPDRTPTGLRYFFSPGFSLRSVMPGSKNGVYAGKVYDGNHQLAHLQPNRFVTFLVTPGSHTFAANYWLSSGTDGAATVTLEVQPGQHYFLQASIKIATIAGVGFILKELPCSDAQQLNKKSRALTGKDVLPDGEKLAVADVDFPACPVLPAEVSPVPSNPKSSLATQGKDLAMSLFRHGMDKVK